MNKLNDTDLREALRRREARRPETAVPEDFCANVMRAVEEQRPKRTWRLAATALAAAASIAIAVVLTWPKELAQPSAPHVGEEQLVGPVIAQAARAQETYTPPQSHPTERKRADAPTANGKHGQHSKPQAKAKAVTESPETAPIDSMSYYLAKLEQGLAHVRDSCQAAHIERLIRADAQLQKIVNTLMIRELMADTVSTASRLTTKYTEL